MKNILFFLAFLTCVLTVNSQGKGTIKGKLLDKEMNNEALSYASVILKGTTRGTETDEEGNFSLFVNPGSYTVIFSFIGYQTLEVPVVVKAGETVTVNRTLEAAQGVALEEVKVTATTTKDKESALLIEQKKAVQIKESIGAQQLSRLGVRNASAATTKISGVSKSDGAGQIYIRGLGDRYLTTTLNGLPVPSDNIDKKNIDLELFPTRFIQNVSISKTFVPDNSSDYASGNINIVSREVSKNKDYQVSVRTGINSNVDQGNFKVTANSNDVSLGFYSQPFNSTSLENAITQQSWNTVSLSAPINRSIGFSLGGITDEDRRWRVLLTGGQSTNFEFREGLFAEYDLGNLRDFVPPNDLKQWNRTINTSLMFHTNFRWNDNNRMSLNAYAINKVVEETFEAGRARTTEIFEELDGLEDGSQFIRDQNIKNTLLTIVQLTGQHKFSEKNTLKWAVGYNYVGADEPNRIRNEVNILNDDPNTVDNEDGVIQLGFTGGFQQRKSLQEITDNEINARVDDELILKVNEDDEMTSRVSFGGSYRYKTRDFVSQFYGVEENTRNTVFPTSIDDLGAIFTDSNITGGLLNVNVLPTDTYDAELQSFAGYVDYIWKSEKFTFQGGVRYQSDMIDVTFDVGNYVNPATGVARIGDANKEYNRAYPFVNLKFDLTEKSSLRLAGSLSQTLPEFKEIAPFEYVSPQGQVTRGNPDLEASRNFNVDVKYEFFPSRDELFSVTTFFKQINDPINKSLNRGGEDIFSFFNTGDQATVFGIELEGRAYIIKKEDDKANLRVAGNVSYISHEQDLRDVLDANGNFISTFKYGGKEKIGLQGASDWTSNLAVTWNSGKEHPYEITLSSNYSSDRIFSLGAPRNQTDPATFFNGEITEKGVVEMDFILNKEINKHWSIGILARNLLNPTITRSQLNQSPVDGIARQDDVLSYSKGINASLSVNYNF